MSKTIGNDRPLLITGGLGFIGSAFIRSAASRGPIVNLDVGTYAADNRRLDAVNKELKTKKIDVATTKLAKIVKEINPVKIVHFAAETM